MINPFKDVNWHPDTGARRSFGKSLIIGFLIVAAMLMGVVRWKTGAWAMWPAAVGACGALLGLLFVAVPRVALPFYILWHGVGCSIGIIVSNAILAGVYYIAITPVGFLLRIFGKDPMQRRFDPAAKTYWQAAEKDTPSERYFGQF